MDEQLMDELSELPGWDELVAAGSVQPLDARVLEQVRTQVRHAAEPSRPPRTLPGWRWGIPVAALVAAVAAAIVVGLVLLGGVLDGQPEAIPVSQPTASPTGRAASCVEGYSLKTLAQRNIAFDGTVERVVAMGEGPVGRVQITFGVNEWFRGGTGQQVTVVADTAGEDADPLDLEQGSRLLVSGQTQQGGLLPIAWTGCGFTRPYDAATAADWKSVLHG
ncbi:MAG TPA: hypothetical protein VFH76_29030 [Kribbella sp.]|nr:hypothetical protein [Kribbella sp.]